MIEHLLFITGATAIAFGLYIVADQLQSSTGKTAKPFHRWLSHSLMFGLMAAGCIGYGHEISKGVLIDARGAVLAVATLVGGYGVGATTAVIALVVRGLVGGAGMPAGMAGIVLDFLVPALLVWLWGRRKNGAPGQSPRPKLAREVSDGWVSQIALLVCCGVGVGVVEAVSLLWIMPAATGQAFFRAAGKELFLTQVACTLLMGGLIRLQQERRRSRALFQTALATSTDAFVLLSPDARIREVNEATERMTGYSRAELLGMNFAQIKADSSPTAAAEWLAKIQAAGQLRFESRWRRKDGRLIDMEVAATTAAGDAGGVYSFARDVTQRKQAEAELRKLNRSLRARSECGKAMLQAEEEVPFLERACSILVKEGGYRFAWVASAVQDEAKSVRPVAQAGFEEGYLETLQLTWADTERGRGPTGISLRTRQRCVNRNIATDPAMAPWRQAALERGYASSAAFPLLHGDELLGSMMVYSPEPNAFDESEVDLLSELVSDLAFGLSALRSRKARTLAEAELRHSEAKFRSIMEFSPVPMALSDDQGNVAYLNPAFTRTLGYRQQDIASLDQWWAKAYPDAAYRQWVVAEWQQRVARASGGLPFENMEVDVRCLDGTQRTIMVGMSHLPGTFQHEGVVVLYDLTERKQMERKLQRTTELLEEAQRTARLGYYVITLASGQWESSAVLDEIFGIDADFPHDVPNWTRLLHPDDQAEALRQFAEAVASSGSFRMDYRVVRPSGGDLRWVAAYGRCESGPEGKPVRLVGCVQDITGRKQAELALQALNEQLEQRVEERTAETLDLYHNAPCGYHSVGADGVVLQMNDTELGWLGYTREEVEGRRRLSDLMTPQSAAGFDERFRAFQAESIQRLWEWDMRCKDGSTVTFLVNAEALRDDAGHFIKSHSTVLNITERKHLELALQEKEERLRLLFESSRDAIIITDLTGRCLDCNSAAVRMYGLADKAEVLARGPKGWSPAQQPDGQPSEAGFGAHVAQALAKGNHLCEWWHQRPDGTLFPAEVSISVAQIRGQTLLQGVVHEISERKAAEAKLRASEAKFRQMIDQAPLPLVLLDQAGNVQLANDRFTRLLGYTIEALPTIEAWWRTALPDENYRRQLQAEWAAAVQAAPANGEVPAKEIQVTAQSGQVFTMLISGTILPNTLLVALQDITGIKLANEKLSTLSQAIEFSPSMIVITDTLGQVEYVNPAWEAVTGYQLAEVLGRKPSAIKSGKHTREFYQHLWSEITAGRVWRGDFCNRRSSGELYWESAAIAPLRNEAGAIAHYVAVKEDITERRRVGEELRQAKEAAEAANRAKSTFLANMSHEIRTPMNAILGFSQLLLRDPALPGHQQRQVATIQRSGEHLLNIINDILEMARVESGRVTLNPVAFDLHLLLDDLERMFSLRAQAKQLSFQVERAGEVPQGVLADETKLRQVIINLLGNALKFTPSGGRITLRLRAEKLAEGKLRLHTEVEDTGAGIAPEDLEHLCKPFFQTQTGKETAGGTGLGLAISREFVRLMGGEFTITSEVGVGSRFQFTALAQAVEVATLAKTTSSRQVLHLLPGVPACRVLVADDQPENRDLLERLLAPLGFDLRFAVNGAEAVAQCQSWLPQVVLMDLRMPVLDGIGAMLQIRAAHGDTVKIIALSASVFADDQQRATSQGADAFLGKPFEQADLLDLIKRLAGVDYVYEGAAAAAPAASDQQLPSAEETRRLPAALVEALREATVRAAYDDMLSLVEQVAVEDESIGLRLRRLVERYDYATLHTILA